MTRCDKSLPTKRNLRFPDIESNSGLLFSVSFYLVREKAGENRRCPLWECASDAGWPVCRWKARLWCASANRKFCKCKLNEARRLSARARLNSAHFSFSSCFSPVSHVSSTLFRKNSFPALLLLIRTVKTDYEIVLPEKRNFERKWKRGYLVT